MKLKTLAQIRRGQIVIIVEASAELAFACIFLPVLPLFPGFCHKLKARTDVLRVRAKLLSLQKAQLS